MQKPTRQRRSHRMIPPRITPRITPARPAAWLTLIACAALALPAGVSAQDDAAPKEAAQKAKEDVQKAVEQAAETAKDVFEFIIPAGLPEIVCPDDNPQSAEKVHLGKMLYFEPRLSADKTVSCASCHDPKKGWSNGEAFATGVGGQKGGRSAPTILNTVYNRFHFWDGRAASLEEQALGPIQNPIEMNLSLEEAVKRLSAIEGYREAFKEAFGDEEVTSERIGKAIAAYERTVICGDAPIDRYKAGDKEALSEAALRGRNLFFGKAVCSSCHSGVNFTDHSFHNVGVGMDKPEPDQGRAAISGLKGDTGSFKTPTLREIARTAPYMHDGSLKTLMDVVEHYNKGGIDNPYLDEEIFPLGLTEQEKKDLVTFLEEGLASESYPDHEAPELPE